MLFYGMIVWILFVIAVWGVGMVRILFFEEDRKHRTLKKTLLKISKWTLKLFGVFLAVAVIGSMAFSYKYQKECGPDSADVKVMKPMAKAISDYIVKHGILRSLSEIPNLPYRLEGCEWKQKNLERCYFYINQTSYQIDSYLLGELDIEIYSKKTETGLRYELEQDSTNKNWKISKKDIAFSSKISGICNPMRQ